ncbi:peptidoglycan DD-metalloendopeptidase family protein [Streptomyces phaeoluteigriseus]|uniref:Peptidoglycan DD-metalloendopeptidase family protein n=1 Tax=Streptomyces phaeoluteigriseus TaxID=114686 RepID=A0ABY4Z1X7_9ACTN|nr:peptidoglycan DD-metalloendopeptidase family protein [Streptomyces phaeoluteigriseus]USQ83062.1 peptidoglycan DD-metalloendopeptidase family protein [Streptomyces phaeoluteigriseus]
MNDRHPSGTMTTPAPASDADSAHQASYGSPEAQYGDFTTYNGYESGTYDSVAHGTGHFAVDPLFGDMPGDGATAASTGAYDTGQWATGSHQTLNHDPYAAQHHAAYDTGAYDTTAWSTDPQQLSGIPPQATAPDVSGQWDASAWLQPDMSAAPAEATQQWEWGTQAFDTGAYDATQWNSDGGAEATESGGEYEQQAEGSFQAHQAEVPFDQQATATFEQVDRDESAPADGEPADGAALLLDDQEEVVGSAPLGRAATRNANRSRRRAPARRSALLTVAVPSACVMGVAGIAAASVGTLTGGDDHDTTASASDAQPVKPSAANNKLDTQLQTLTAEADDFADRASRTQERIDLKAQQEAEKKKAAAEAARKERLRPKYALPVSNHGLSAYYGQSGINWMSQHTGIDFPVSYGTTVMAATDGVVRTQWNSAYGNMMIVTAKDGTETWYCHLSSYRVASGTTVKAGDPIAYSGNSGNSTGPHLHFEVRPGGASAIDPLPWLRSHGIDPT